MIGEVKYPGGTATLDDEGVQTPSSSSVAAYLNAAYDPRRHLSEADGARGKRLLLEVQRALNPEPAGPA